MTDEESLAFDALRKGRLIFPFEQEHAELGKLRARTSEEQERFKALDDARTKIVAKDKWFHSAMQAGDLEAAGKVATEALEIAEELE